MFLIRERDGDVELECERCVVTVACDRGVAKTPATSKHNGWEGGRWGHPGRRRRRRRRRRSALLVKIADRMIAEGA
jgi:hypothetical protein